VVRDKTKDTCLLAGDTGKLNPKWWISWLCLITALHQARFLIRAQNKDQLATVTRPLKPTKEESTARQSKPKR
jgi:hypothetical protein